MNIDKRYIELLAKVAPPAKENKRLTRFYVLSFLAVMVGGLLVVSGYYIGFIIGPLGVVGMILVLIKKSKEDKMNRRAFLEYYDKKHEFPPWPEDAKK